MFLIVLPNARLSLFDSAAMARRPPRRNRPTRRGRRWRRGQNSRERAEPLSLERGKREKDSIKMTFF